MVCLEGRTKIERKLNKKTKMRKKILFLTAKIQKRKQVSLSLNFVYRIKEITQGSI